MGKLEDAKEVLKALGLPKRQQNDRSAYTLLAMLGLAEDDIWSNATNNPIGIHDIMGFMKEKYNKIYAENSRETIRKESIHQFIHAVVAEQNVDEAERATNSPKYSYRVTPEALEVCKSFQTGNWRKNLASFIEDKGTLEEVYAQKREMVKLPINVNNQELRFSPGKHNTLIKAIIEQFAPRFAQHSEVFYCGDTVKKDLYKNDDKLRELGVRLTDHDKLPDVVLYREDKNWLYFVEAVTSVGPVNMKRKREIEEMLEKCDCGIIYVTAFLDMSTNKRFIDDIAWETEVWIAENPDHMIHLNGDKFLGPR